MAQFHQNNLLEKPLMVTINKKVESFSWILLPAKIGKFKKAVKV